MVLEEFEFGFGGHPRLVFVTILRLVFWRVRVWFLNEFAFGFVGEFAFDVVQL